MSKPTDIQVIGTKLHFIPITTRVPLKFGTETVTAVTCARARVRVADRHGRTAEGWGETPLSVQWVWPGRVPYESRLQTLEGFCLTLAKDWISSGATGHPIEIGHEFQKQTLPNLCDDLNRRSRAGEPMPWLAALLCCSVFDQAIHDAYGNLLKLPVYETYTAEFMNRDLSAFLEPGADAGVSFIGKYPEDYLLQKRVERLNAWHLVGGLDPLDQSELRGAEPNDGYPVLLEEWIRRDGLNCLKVKLCGTDAGWDYQRLVKVGSISRKTGVEYLSADFNCTVNEPSYVNAILDRLKIDQPRLFDLLLYVEQPFPYELEKHRIDVHSVSSRRPLFLDESAHDWRLVKLGRDLGWTGVALKTCKTQTGALLSGCWAKAHGMQLMVQDLTNPMLAQIPHLLLAAHFGTINGVETNAMQFYPEASTPEAAVHPGIYKRRNGVVDLSTIRGHGFGYRIDEMRRDLPAPAAQFDL